MDDDSISEPPNSQSGVDGSGLGRGFKRERGLSKALSVLRASTKLQPQRRGSSSHLRVVEEDDGFEAEEDSTSVDDSARRRTGSGAAPLPRNISRQRAASVVAPVEVQRRNAPRGEWSPAEEAVLARKHMELGNKWTTISHFLPARSDNDVKNIWHSTLRSKNSERRSFLRTYARAVRDCANDAEARKQAYEMAHRVCGPPQPIEQALAVVQQQYQQQLQLQASMADEVLTEGDSPEFFPPDDRDAAGAHDGGDREQEPPAAPASAQTLLGAQQHHQQHHQQESGPTDLHRSGTCSRTNSAQDPQYHHHHHHHHHQHSNGARGSYPRGIVMCGASDGAGPSTSPLDTLDAAAAAAGGFLSYPPHMQARGSLTQDSGHSLGPSASGHQLPNPHPHPHHPHHQQFTEDGPQPHPQAQPHPSGPTQAVGSSHSGAEVDTSCLARFSALQLADQRLQRQQKQHQQQMLQHHQHQQKHQQQQQMLHMQQQQQQQMQADMLALANSSSSGQHAQQHPHAHLQGRTQPAGGTASMTHPHPHPHPQPQSQQQQQQAAYGSGPGSETPGGGPPSGVDFDDMLALGLDLTAEDLAVLGGQQQQQQQQPAGGGQGGPSGAGPGRGGDSDEHAAAAAAVLAQRSRSFQQQQQQQVQAPPSLEHHQYHQQQQQMMLMRDSQPQPQPQQPQPRQPGSAVLERQLSGVGRSRGPSSDPLLPTAAGERLLSYQQQMQQMQHQQQQQQQQQHHHHQHQQQQQQQQQQQPDSFDSLLVELGQRSRHRLRAQTQQHFQTALQQQQQHHGGSLSLQLPDQHQQQQQHQQQDDVLGLGLGSPYAYRCYPGPASLETQSLGSAGGGLRCGFIAPHNTVVELQSLASCSSTLELLNSGQQACVDGAQPQPQQHPHQQQLGPGQQQHPLIARRGSALGMFGTGLNGTGCHDSFSNASSGLLSPLGIGSGHATLTGHQRPGPGTGVPQFPLPGFGPGGGGGGGSGVWHASACGSGGSTAPTPGGAAGFGTGLVRLGGVGGASRTLSSPVAFCGEASAGGDAAAAAAGPGGAAPGAGGGGGSGLVGGGRGSGLVPSMSSLAVPTPVDVVTMGLESGDLLDCLMDCATEGEPPAEAEGGSGSGGVTEEMLDMALRASARAALMQQQNVQQQQQQHPRQQQLQHQHQHQQMAGGRGPLMQGSGGSALSQTQCWPAAAKAQSFSTGGMLGPLLRL